MGDGAARHRSALQGTVSCRVVAHQNKNKSLGGILHFGLIFNDMIFD